MNRRGQAAQTGNWEKSALMKQDLQHIVDLKRVSYV
jgi:hypothetical protein